MLMRNVNQWSGVVALIAVGCLVAFGGAGDRVVSQASAQPSGGGASAGRNGLAFNYVILKASGRVELYIDLDQDTGEGNKVFFRTLESEKAAIETEFGAPLDWDPLEGARACRISVTINTGGWRDEEKWPAVQDDMIDAMIRLEKALRPRIDKL